MNILLPCGHESETPKDDCLPCSKYVADPKFKELCEKIHKERQLKQLPPIKAQVDNLVKARERFINSELPLIESQLHKDRLVICQNCTENMNGTCVGINKETNEACGCVIAVKAKIPTEQCPAGKWPKVNLEVLRSAGGCGGCGGKNTLNRIKTG